MLRNSEMDFVDLTPCGRNKYCSGGGGGALTMSEYRNKRLESAKVKADQIKATGAKVVSTSCHNCIDQLAEINRHYKLGVKVVNTCELTADAIVLPRRMFQASGVPVQVGERGYLKDPADWNRDVAQFLATGEGIGELQDDHWRIVDYVRGYTDHHGAWPLPQRISKDLGLELKRFFRGGPEVVFKVAGLADPGDKINWHGDAQQDS